MAAFRRLFSLGRMGRAAARSDVDAEIAAHLDETEASLVRQGMSPAEAQNEALRRFGDLAATRQAMTGAALRRQGRLRRRDRLEAWWTDLRYSVRQVRRSPGLAAAIVLTLALGIGAGTAMFAVLDRLLLRLPAGIRAAHEVHRIYLTRREGTADVTNTEVSLRRLQDLRDGTANLIDIAGWSETPVVAGEGDSARDVGGAFVTDGFWRVLGVRAALGRLLDTTDAVPPHGIASVVLGHAYWMTDFAGDSSVIGRSLAIGMRRFTVVGVLPRGLNGLGGRGVDVWLPAATAGAVYTFLTGRWLDSYGFSWLSLIGRLRPGATAAQAESQLQSAHKASLESRGDTTALASAGAGLWSLLEQRGPERDDNTRVALWLGAVALVVLLLACTNVANLLLSRSIDRRAEVGVRLALGISRSRLVRQLLLESAVLAGAGAIAGVAVARLALGVLGSLLLPGQEPVAVDERILLFAVGAAVFASLVSGLGPVAYGVSADVRALLGAAGRASRHSSRLRAGLLIGQTALSTILLVGAGLFVRSLDAAGSTHLGYDADRLLLARLRLRSTEPPPGGLVAAYGRLAQVARSVPGIASATTTLQVPFMWSSSIDIDVPGVDSASRLGQFRANPVGEDYFETMGTRILQGRGLTREDRLGAPLVVVVSDSMARVVWPGRMALGQCVRVGGADRPCSEVVGVAENIHQFDIRSENTLQYWYPEAQQQGESASRVFGMIARASSDGGRMEAALRDALQRELPASVYLTVTPLARLVDRVLRPWRLGATVFTAFGALGVAIASVGLFSVLAYAVGQRRHEFGVRLALGAPRPGLLGLVLVQGLRLTLAGVVAGLAVCLAAGSWLEPLLFGIGPRDPRILASVAGLLALTAIVAGILPAWRATRVDPSLALKEQG